MGASDTCKKIIIVTLNLIFLVFGGAVLALGIVLKISWDDIKHAYTEDSEFSLQMASISGIILGVFIILLSLAGMCGACFRSKCLLGVYGAVVVILLIAEIGVTIAIATNAFGSKDKFKEELGKSLKGFKEDLSDDHSKGWAAMFSLFDCCGVTDNPVQDFKAANWSKSTKRAGSEKAEFPVACCKEFKYKDGVKQEVFKNKEIEKCLAVKEPNSETAYVKGCEAKMEDFFKDNKVKVIAVGCSLFAVQLIIAIMAFCLMRDEDD